MPVRAPSSAEIAARQSSRQTTLGVHRLRTPMSVAQKPGWSAFDAGAVEPARQRIGEQDVAELGQPVGPQAVVSVLALQVVEVELGAVVGRRSDVDDAGVLCGPQRRQQEFGEQNVAKVVEGERHLDAVGAQRPFAEHADGIVDQHVEARPAFEDRFGEGANVRLPGQVRPQEDAGTAPTRQ